MTKEKPLVSIVVTTKNEELNIRYCLLSIKAQSYKNIEIIVVDNKSNDNTKQIAKKYTNLVFDKGPERSAQRNYGMLEVAEGDYLMFIDADMILSPGLIESCVKYIERKCCAALYIPEIILGNNYFSKIRRFERSFYNGTVIDGARFFRKDIFRQVNGFDETMSGPEDWDIDKKIKLQNKINVLSDDKNPLNQRNWILNDFITKNGVNPDEFDDAIFHNESKMKLKRYLLKKSYYSDSFRTYIDKWGVADHDIRKQFGFAYRFFFVFLEGGKWMRFLRNPHLVIGLYSLRFLVGLTYLKSKYK